MSLGIEDDATQSPPERQLVREYARPLARTVFYVLRGARARGLARVRRTRAVTFPAPVFVVGCGRSGTTLLGNLLGLHPAVTYLNEPYDLWAAIEPATDVLQLYSRGEHHCLLDASAVTIAARRRFGRLMSTPPGVTMVEKSPTNTLRIGYLDAIVPNARFVHIVRDGVEVSHSIQRMAAVNRRMLFRPLLNEWWGVGDVKWGALERDGRTAGYYSNELHHLNSDVRRGAYEWLISLRQVEAWRMRLASRYVEVRYQDLTKDPRGTLEALMGSLQLSSPEAWLQQAIPLVTPAKNREYASLLLPDQMCADFNRVQESFGFKGRAASQTSAANEFGAPPSSA